MGSGRSSQTPSPRNRIQIHLGKENEGSWREEKRGRGGERITQSNRRTTYTLGCCWGRSGGKAPVGRWAAPTPVPAVFPGAPGCSVPVGKRWHLPRTLVQPGAGPPLQREVNPALWALGETNHWQILEKHLLKSLMP